MEKALDGEGSKPTDGRVSSTTNRAKRKASVSGDTGTAEIQRGRKVKRISNATTARTLAVTKRGEDEESEEDVLLLGRKRITLGSSKGKSEDIGEKGETARRPRVFERGKPSINGYKWTWS
jgi:hypothetical protein